MIKHVLSDRPGNSQVVIAGSPPRAPRATTVADPNAFERSPLEGAFDSRQPAQEWHCGNDVAGQIVVRAPATTRGQQDFAFSARTSCA